MPMLRRDFLKRIALAAGALFAAPLLLRRHESLGEIELWDMSSGERCTATVTGFDSDAHLMTVDLLPLQLEAGHSYMIVINEDVLGSFVTVA